MSEADPRAREGATTKSQVLQTTSGLARGGAGERVASRAQSRTRPHCKIMRVSESTEQQQGFQRLSNRGR